MGFRRKPCSSAVYVLEHYFFFSTYRIYVLASLRPTSSQVNRYNVDDLYRLLVQKVGLQFWQCIVGKAEAGEL